MKKLIIFLVFGLLCKGAHASLITGEVAEDAYVTFNGYDLAWASPCSDGILEWSCGSIDMSEQSGYGWEIMTSDLFSSLGISASTFIVDYSSANTQLYNGNNYAKASGWFSNSYTHIDVNDGVAGRWSFADIEEACCHETIVYRSSNEVVASVPEPASIALISIALAGLGFSRKKSHD